MGSHQGAGPATVPGVGAATIRRLGAGLAGSVVLPEDPEFPQLRRLFQARPGAEVRPRAVARCADPADVAESIRFARAHRLPFALRSGGHSFADFCTTDGLLIDLAGLDSARPDGEAVTVGPGIRLGPLADRLAAHDRVLPCGWNPLVAVGGAVLGGGYGMLSRRYGLGCDHLLAAQVVLADGRVVWTDERREPDLFWALRGAGWAGFGAVTALVLRTRPAPPVVTFVHHWSGRHAVRVIDAWQRWAPAAPDWLNAELVIQRGDPEQEPQLTLFGAAVGTGADARRRLAELLARVGAGDDLEELTELSPRAGARRHTYAGKPVLAVAPARLPPDYQPWLRVVKSEFFARPLPREAIEALVASFVTDHLPGQYRELELIPWGGAFRRVDPAATAFVHRTPQFQIGHHGMVRGGAAPEEQQAVHAWVNRSWQVVHPAGSGGVYPNYPDADLAGWARAYYGDNLPRLSRIRARYDPDGGFRFAQAVPLALR